MKNKLFVLPQIEKNTIEELSEKLIKTNRELEQLKKEREISFANISHDLRAPMTAIRSALDLALCDDSMSREELFETLRIIDRRSKTLEALIGDMYYLYTVEKADNGEKFEEIEAVPFLEEFYYDLTADPRYDDFDLKLDIEPGNDCLINVCVQEIVRVLDNLFSNALKYSGKGSVIKLKARYGDGALSVSVADNGAGIPKDKLNFIFDRTYTVSDARTPLGEKTGSGLGLAIVKAIIEKHGGSIICKSDQGKGTEFTVTLPAVSL